MKNLLFILTISLPVLLLSCMKELGSYDYVEVNEIKIDSIKGRTITQYDTLRIAPTITSSMDIDEADLEYLWYWYKSGAGENAEMDTLSHEKNLTYYVAAGPGLYNARLKVTDKNSGLFARKEFDVSVEAENSGLLILSDLGGKANLSLLNLAGTFSEDVYYAANGEYAGERPVAIADIDNSATD